MTVSSSVNKVQYAGNSATLVFPVNYYFLENSHLKVILRTAAGIETVQTLTTNYTVTGAGNPAGGSVTMLVAPVTGTTLTIVRNVPATQETDYLANDPFPAESHERALDKLTMLVQENEEFINRAIQIPQTDSTSINTIVPSSTVRAAKLLGFDADGSVAISDSTIAQLDAAIASFINATGNNAASILYDPAGTGALQTNVQTKLRGIVSRADYNSDGNYDTARNALTVRVDHVVRPEGASFSRLLSTKLSEVITFKDFGATGDGTTNDATAIQATLDAANGKIIDGQNLTYKVNTTITLTDSNTVIKNATFDFSDYPDAGAGADRCLNIYGSIGTANSLTANINKNDATVTIASTTGFLANDLVFLKSNAVWDSNSSVTYGQYARIKSISSLTQFVLCEGVHLAFNTTDSATVAKVTPVQNVVIDHVTFLGADANSQNALYVQYGENVSITNCEFKEFDYAAVAFFRCYQSTVDKCRQRNSTGVGLAYGYALIDGCYACSVTNSWGEDNRHTVTIGGIDGINMFTKVIGCHASGSKDAGFDSHSASLHTLFMGNHVSMSATRFGASAHDGLISQGANTSFIGNTVLNTLNSGIFYQPLFQDGTYSGATITDNTVVMDSAGDGSTGSGIYIQVGATVGPDDLNGILIKNNRISGGDANAAGAYGIYVAVQKTNAEINGLIVDGNYVTLANATTAYPLFVRTLSAGAVISNVVVSNNVLKADNDDYAVFFQASNATSSITNITGTSNIFDSDLFSIILSPTGTISKIRFSKNVSLAPDFIDNNGATDYLFDDIEAAGVFTATNATLVDLTEYNWYVFNRAGTVTVTLPPATTSKGRTLNFKTIQAQTVVSASSNVQPIGDTTLATAILPATDGAWATLYSNGTSWVIMARG